MRLKSFQAKTMNEALRQVKDVMGDDAIIVSTREESGIVRITAAIEHIPEKQSPPPDIRPAAAPTARKTAPPAEEDPDTIMERITDALLKHRVPAQVSEKILSAAEILHAPTAQKTLERVLEKVFRFMPAADLHVPLMLAGPPGAGKTLMTAKLAARAVMDGVKPAVITTDIARAGGVEQLSAFLNIMNIDLLQAEDAKTLGRVLAGLAPRTPTIIDTGGLNPFDPQEMKTLAQLLSVTEMETALVLPAGMDAEESAEIAMTFEILGAKKLIPTRLDFARRIGGILSAADKAGLGFAEASRTPQVADGITQLTPDILAGILIPAGATTAAEKLKRGSL